jgi:ubiquinone/menaquinone biosynthesis C-methylase UbiE
VGNESSNGSRYVHDDRSGATKDMATRTAAGFAAFFLPLLRPGMSLLDCGCGPGSITADLARAVSPGEAVGLDFQQSQIDAAASLATARGVSNARFVRGDIYQLPFGEATFDAAYANMVMEHLSQPLAALREMHRVLKPGGVVGVQSPDFGSMMLAPEVPLLARALELCIRFRRYNGGDPGVGRKLRAYMIDAGFGCAEASATLYFFGSDQTTPRGAQWIVNQLGEPLMRRQVVELGWADERLFEEATEAAIEFGGRPDAVFGAVIVAAVGRK